MKQTVRLAAILVLACVTEVLIPAVSFAKPLPFVKQFQLGKGQVRLTTVSVSAGSKDLANEVQMLKEALKERRIRVRSGRFPIRLEMATVSFPEIRSDYREEVESQGYRLRINDKRILIQAESPAGVFYGIQTLAQLIDSKGRVPKADILDWPDLAVRMIMVDPARQNENIDYFKRLIQFCGRYKLNGLHLHLTDDQFSALYHEDYPWIMHPEAMRPEQADGLVAYAKKHHVDIMPEIESLGHSGMFERHPMMREILHQAPLDAGWHPINSDNYTPGFINVLCPASELTYEYLDKMYARSAEAFPYPAIHVGLDEVEMTGCGRCEKKFPDMSKLQWFSRHVRRCIEIASKHGRKIAIWNDMPWRIGPEAERQFVGQMDPKDIVIMDWHYGPVPQEHCRLYKQKGFDVIGCPALGALPDMLVPAPRRFANIQEFAAVARQHDLMGIDTTIWCPQYRMSDILWTGLAFSAVQSWAGGNYDESAFYSNFLLDFFGSGEGSVFAQAWRELSGFGWEQNDIWVACWFGSRGAATEKIYRSNWFDRKKFGQSREIAINRGEHIRSRLNKLADIRRRLSAIGSTVTKNKIAWDVIEQSAAIAACSMEHLLASTEVYTDGKWDKQRIRELDKDLLQVIKWIEDDWDRNRFVNDLGKDGIALGYWGHLLHWFKLSHKAHQKILSE